MIAFEQRLRVPVPARELHDWHLRPGAFERLSPPWERMRPLHAEPVAEGSRRVFEVKKGGLWLRWSAVHRGVVPGVSFTDVQEQGPFHAWIHEHRFEPEGDASSLLVDHVDYALPLGRLGQAVAGRGVAGEVARMFAYRHRITAGDLALHARFLDRPKLRVAVTGASGLIGQQLVSLLRTGGHQVLRLVRRDGEPAEDEVRWSLEGGVVDHGRLEGIDAVVHLAGESVGQRWTASVKRRILDSRRLGTRRLVEALSRLREPPRVLVSASAVGYYGDVDRVVDESAPAGDDFLAEVCRHWEAEARSAEAFGCRTVQLRIGVVMDPRGGALAKLLPVFQAGLGGPVGGGRQLVSWVGLDDVLGAILTAMQDESLAGPVNVTGPEPVTQAELARTLGSVLHRPAILPTPGAAVALLFGEMGRATVLASTGAAPTRLQQAGYRFRAPTLEAALRHGLGAEPASSATGERSECTSNSPTKPQAAA